MYSPTLGGWAVPTPTPLFPLPSFCAPPLLSRTSPWGRLMRLAPVRWCTMFPVRAFHKAEGTLAGPQGGSGGGGASWQPTSTGGGGGGWMQLPGSHAAFFLPTYSSSGLFSPLVARPRGVVNKSPISGFGRFGPLVVPRRCASAALKFLIGDGVAHYFGLKSSNKPQSPKAICVLLFRTSSRPSATNGWI